MFKTFDWDGSTESTSEIEYRKSGFSTKTLNELMKEPYDEMMSVCSSGCSEIDQVEPVELVVYMHKTEK